jgi:cell division protein FtsB
MLQYNERTKLRKRLYSWPVFALLLVLTVLVVKGTWSVYWKRVESIQNLDKVTQEAAALESREAALNADISKLQTQAGVEEEIRKKYSVVKDGEQVVVVVDDQQQKAAPSQPKPGFFKRMWNAIAGIFGGGEKATTTETVEQAIGTSTP